MGTITPEETDAPDPPGAAANIDRQTVALEKIAEGMQAVHADLQAIIEALRRTNSRLGRAGSD